MSAHNLIESAHEIMLLITLATSEGSGEPAHARLKNELQRLKSTVIS